VEADKIFLTKIRRQIPDNALKNPAKTAATELLRFTKKITPGARICIAVGSRGIKNLELIVKETISFIRQQNALPFIVPAMGSHGEATAEGQAEILAGYGISEDKLGVPVLSSMEVVDLPAGSCEAPVFMDRNAWESDGIILINRVKPHTDFHAKYESGLVKLSVIGLGKEKQASAIHRFGVYGLSSIIPKAAEVVLATGKIIGGIAIAENASDETMLVKALLAEEFIEKEPEILRIARENMPALPVDDIDLLIIDQIGKDISGVGLDPNIIGRIRITGQPEPEKPSVKAIMLAGISAASHGNAIGMGLADVITRSFYECIDFNATYINGITSSFIERIKIPVICPTDRAAFETALRSCHYIPEGSEKIVRIINTLHLDVLWVSDTVAEILKEAPDIEITDKRLPLFMADGKMIPF
jgi:hypothetical protein